MGQSESSFQCTYTETVPQISSVQLGEIAARFNELYGKAGGPWGHVVDREAFSRYFKFPVAVGDRLFDTFDRKKVMETSWLAVTFPPLFLPPSLLPSLPPSPLSYLPLLSFPPTLHASTLSPMPRAHSLRSHLACPTYAIMYFVMDSI